MEYLFYIFNLLNQHGDIESNSRPVKDKFRNISCCPWNVNSLVAHNYSKQPHFEAYNSVYNYEFICISETYFYSSNSLIIDHVQLSGYNLIRSNHTSSSKRSGVCL